MTGKTALMETLIAEGVTHIFGNPGTSEAAIMSTLEAYPSIDYVLVVQEGVAVGMADGYARRTGRPSFVNLHIDAGLANGVSLLSDAFLAGIPIVVTAGNSDVRKAAAGRNDVTKIVEPFVKWSAEATHAGQVSSLLRRAFTEAMTPPTGPVFVSFAANALDDEAEQEIYPSARPRIASTPDEEATAAAVSILVAAERPVMLVGDRVWQSGGAAEAVRVAELTGARVYSSGYTGVSFPTSHPQYVSNMSLRSPAIKRSLMEADVVLAVGTRVFSEFFQIKGPNLGSETRLIHIDSNGSELGRSERTELAILADARAALVALGDGLMDRQTGATREAARTRAATIGSETRGVRDAFARSVVDSGDQRPMTADRMMSELAAAWPSDAVMVDDSISSRSALYPAFEFTEPGSLEGEVGAAIGWGMGAALGVKLAEPDRPVISVLGDGTAMMTVQALWTAKARNIPVVYVICNNGMYRVLRLNMDVYLNQILEEPERPRGYTATQFSPSFDFAAIARAFGMNSARIEDPADIASALQNAVESHEPWLLDVIIDGSH